MNCNGTGKLQVILLFSDISWKKFCSHTFKVFRRSNRDAFLENEGKIYEERYVKKSFS